ncbi:histidine phosphotransferase [Paracoccus sp. Z118]|uniref:histidine phosphotransferase family protein n=1 Tax=Paracoccus sp. Z118 TaxID=2851017 RepID=UPI001C2BCF89|nr:histidine phosphotransferase family protein [Paracoccus sp. Z118]MBV0890275.1 histidine phosphotransferase [Paracoccus sp. Z118]
MDCTTSPALPAIAAERLAALVASRLCHDLVSPLGAIGNGVELIEMGGPPAPGPSPELQLIADSVEAARARIRVFRVAFGHTAPDQRLSVGDLRNLLRDIGSGGGAGGRLQVQLDAEGDLPRGEARMILLAVMCLETALPWGGRVLICRGAQGWRLVAEAARTRPAPHLWAWLQPGRSHLEEPSAPEVQFALLAAHALAAGRPLAGELDESGAEISF